MSSNKRGNKHAHYEDSKNKRKLLKSWTGTVDKIVPYGVVMRIKDSHGRDGKTQTGTFRRRHFNQVDPSIGQVFTIKIWSDNKIVIRPLNLEPGERSIAELLDLLDQIQ